MPPTRTRRRRQHQDQAPADRDNRTYWRDKYGPKSKKVKKEPSVEDKDGKDHKDAEGDRDSGSPPEQRERAFDLHLNDQCLEIIQNTLTEAEKLVPHAGKQTHQDPSPLPVEIQRVRRWCLDPADAESRSAELQEQRKTAQSLNAKLLLPMNEVAHEVCQIVSDNQFCTIVGETGSGKTTQVPQILLDQAVDEGMGSAVNIICTQPRRIAATSVAQRVASERNEVLGNTVGYHIRHESQLPAYGGSITYCTTGILLRQLSYAEDILDAFSHIILDEVHERDINLDFTLIMLKRAFIERARVGKPVPKLILMSATVDTTLFQHYFADPRLGTLAAECPVLRVPGRTFPVQRHYIQDIMDSLRNTRRSAHLEPLKHRNLLGTQGWIGKELNVTKQSAAPTNKKADFPPATLFTTLIAHVVSTTKSGAILVFLPGMAEIREITTLLLHEPPLGINFRDATKFNIFQLHSQIEKDQRTVFEKSPRGVRKIILSTNIAETSVTIPDVTVVIDSGHIRRMQYEPAYRRSELMTSYVSQSNLAQRAGRAGRVQAGDYYALFHRHRAESLPAMPTPEMRLANLGDLSLTIRAQRDPVPIAEFLADALEPPSETAVKAAISDLIGLGAITEDEDITPLGRVLAQLPLGPSLGKLIVLGILFECLDPIIILGGAYDSNPFDRGTLETEDAAARARWNFGEGSFSDHLALLHAYEDIRAAVRKKPDLNIHAWCSKNYLRPVAMTHIEQNGCQVEHILAEAGLVSAGAAVARSHSNTPLFRTAFGPAHLNTNSHNEPLICAVLAAGLQPNMAWGKLKRNKDINYYHTPVNKKASMSTGWAKMVPNLHYRKKTKVLSALPIMLYENMIFNQLTKNTFMSAVTPISPLLAALFGDNVRKPALADLEYLRKQNADDGAALLVVGRGNRGESPENGDIEKSPRLALKIGTQYRPDDDEARDALLRFRQGLGHMLDRVLVKLTQHRQDVDGDPAWRLYVDAIVKLTEADKWDGIGRAWDIVQKMQVARPKDRGKEREENTEEDEDEEK